MSAGRALGAAGGLEDVAAEGEAADEGAPRASVKVWVQPLTAAATSQERN
jgi:hypothetical protein